MEKKKFKGKCYDESSPSGLTPEYADFLSADALNALIEITYPGKSKKEIANVEFMFTALGFNSKSK